MLLRRLGFGLGDGRLRRGHSPFRVPVAAVTTAIATPSVSVAQAAASSPGLRKISHSAAKDQRRCPQRNREVNHQRMRAEGELLCSFRAPHSAAQSGRENRLQMMGGHSLFPATCCRSVPGRLKARVPPRPPIW
jgi:hypothetical protein